MHPSFDIHCENPERGLVDPHMPLRFIQGNRIINLSKYRGLCLEGTMPYDCMPQGDMPFDRMP